MQVNSSVSPSLHPGVVSAIDGYDDDTSAAVADVLAAFETAYSSLSAVHTARQAAASNPALNEAAQVLVTADFADKHFKKIAGKFDSAATRLKGAIADAERQLAQPLEGAAAGGYTAEIRAHVKSLAREDRARFMKDALDARDLKTLAAVLGAPPYLAGLSSAERDVHTRSYHEAMNPNLAKRLSVMKAGQALLFSRSGMVFSEIDKAVGADGKKVAVLREARAKAESAYTFTS